MTLILHNIPDNNEQLVLHADAESLVWLVGVLVSNMNTSKRKGGWGEIMPRPQAKALMRLLRKRLYPKWNEKGKR